MNEIIAYSFHSYEGNESDFDSSRGQSILTEKVFFKENRKKNFLLNLFFC
jgi:hypothetical protein